MNEFKKIIDQLLIDAETDKTIAQTMRWLGKRAIEQNVSIYTAAAIIICSEMKLAYREGKDGL